MSGKTTAAVDIARSPQEVFGFLTDATHLPDWQPDVRTAAFDGPAPVTVGTRGHEVRHVMGADRTIAWEVTAYDPGRRYGVRGVDGPVRANVDVTFTPEGQGTHVEYGIAFEGHGVGRFIAPLARRNARKQVPATLGLLKQHLEAQPHG
ncbi:SRPBCC family protein [Amycolatopsis sp. 3B14]|uniref:SRPBCC family protein n=1 Tax=Amycolatopsis sp. 3B14 TaxID=3243600 RepID=UPI003D986D1A